jgi:hypothetical protein
MPPVPTSALACVTTVHVALVVLRRHRLPGSSFPWALFLSLLFCASPWLFPSNNALAAGMVLHLAWFIACEKLVPAAWPKAWVAAETMGHTEAAGSGLHSHFGGDMTVSRLSETGRAMARALRVTSLAAAVIVYATTAAHAQISQLVSPGPLSKAHASLEGVDKCQKCHEPGRKVTNDLCLSCHKPIADRIRLKKGVHRDATGDCAGCHVEHAGVDAELRPFDQKNFDHGTETGFVLDGRHVAIAKDCAKCHKTRSFLSVTPTCSTCHIDIHKPSLGSDCRACHSTAVPFKDARSRFDHSKAAFQLTGAHRTVACAKCHVNQVFKGVKFAQCTDCHKSPHRQPMGNTCTSCHTNDTWKTTKVDHAKTSFALRGKHADVACVKCHTRPPLQAAVKFDRCASCHQDPHRGAFKQDCSSCHNERGFGRGTFDHGTGTKFPLTGGHAPLACTKCHKNASGTGAGPARVVDFRGLSTACASCHADVHKAELGKACEACHTPVSFRVSAFTHPRTPAHSGRRVRRVIRRTRGRMRRAHSTRRAGSTWKAATWRCPARSATSTAR